jgi:hypothetical protein
MVFLWFSDHQPVMDNPWDPSKIVGIPPVDPTAIISHPPPRPAAPRRAGAQLSEMAAERVHHLETCQDLKQHRGRLYNTYHGEIYIYIDIDMYYILYIWPINRWFTY